MGKIKMNQLIVNNNHHHKKYKMKRKKRIQKMTNNYKNMKIL